MAEVTRRVPNLGTSNGVDGHECAVKSRP